MRPDEQDAALLWDMVRHAREVSEMVRGRTVQDYMSQRILRLAVERLVQIIGEAAYQVTPGFRDATPQIPWIPIIKQRHVLVHDYGEIEDDKIWRVATVHAPALIPLVEAILPAPPPDPFPEPGGSAG